MHDATRAERRAARERVSVYYDAELARLVGHVEQAIARYRTGELDVIAVDEVIHRYSKAARALWAFCWGRGAGTHAIAVVQLLDLDLPGAGPRDWWADAKSRRDTADPEDDVERRRPDPQQV